MLDRTTTQLFEAPEEGPHCEYVCKHVTWRKPDGKSVPCGVWRVHDNETGEILGVVNVSAFRSATEFDEFMRKFVQERIDRQLAP